MSSINIATVESRCGLRISLRTPGASVRLEELAARDGLDKATLQVRIGTTKAEIVATAEECAADLIILGAHERHGLAMLINHTGDTMLHAAPCDVLAIRLER